MVYLYTLYTYYINGNKCVFSVKSRKYNDRDSNQNNGIETHSIGITEKY